MNQEYKNEYREVNIADYIKVIGREKKLILGVFLIVVIGAGVYSFFIVPEVYKVETSLEIGTIRPQEEEPRQMIEELPQVLEKIRSGFYGRYPGLEVINPKSTNLVQIEVISKNPEEAKKALENINKEVLADHNSRIDSQKNMLKNQIDNVNKTIENLRKDISFLILRDQQIAGLQAKIYDLQLKINNLEKQAEDFQPTKVINEPTISGGPIKPKHLFNLVIAAILGIFLGIVLAFGKEWWEKSKQNF